MDFKTFQDIAGLSTALTSEYLIKFAEYARTAGKLGDKISKGIPTDGRSANILLNQTWEKLRQIGLNDLPYFHTTLGSYINREIKRWAEGFTISQIDWEKPEIQSQARDDLDQLTAEAAYLRSRNCADILINGTDATKYPVYTGKALFATDHSFNGYTWSNLLSIASFDADAVNQVKTQLRRVPLGPDGSSFSMNNAKFYIVIPPELEMTANLIINNSWYVKENITSNYNPVYNIAELIVEPLLTDTNDWYMFAEAPGMKPFATVYNNKLTDGLNADLTSDEVMQRRIYKWWVDKHEASYPVHPFMIVKVVASGS